jgi:hypothetical protein
MLNTRQIAARREALRADAQTIYKQFEQGAITEQAFSKGMSRLEAEAEKIETAEETHFKALRYAGSGDSAQQHGLNAFTNRTVAKTMQAGAVKNAFAASPLLSPDAEPGWRAAFKSLAQGQGFRFELKGPGFAANAQSKAGPDFATEGSPGSLLEPILLPQAFREALEPTRVWSLLPGQAMSSQSVAYIRHTGNSQVAAVTPETNVLPDLGMQFELHRKRQFGTPE